MALAMTYWRPEGMGHGEIRTTRLLRFDRELQALRTATGDAMGFDRVVRERPDDCALITVSRTDRQSPTEWIIWEGESRTQRRERIRQEELDAMAVFGDLVK